MKKIFIQNITAITIPFIAYMVLDFFLQNIVASILIAAGISVVLFFIYFFIFKKNYFFIFSFTVVLTLMSIFSVIIDDSLYFKLSLAVFESLLFVFILIMAFSEKIFSKVMPENFKIPENKYGDIQTFFLFFAPIVMLHAILIVVSAIFLSEIMWSFISVGVLYVTSFVFFITFFLVKCFNNRSLMNKYKDDEWFDVVDEESRVIGKAPRSICHNGSKLLHPVVHIHVINSKNKLLLQKRKLTKKIQPGKWDTSVGGHISSGETLESAINREALEELGIDIVREKLMPLSKYVYESDVEKELVFSFVYVYDGEVKFQESEIDEVNFFTSKQIDKLIENNETTPNFIKELELLKNSKIM